MNDEYDVIVAPSIMSLIQSVDRYMARGYKCQGGFTYLAHAKSYAQAIIKEGVE